MWAREVLSECERGTQRHREREKEGQVYAKLLGWCCGEEVHLSLVKKEKKREEGGERERGREKVAKYRPMNLHLPNGVTVEAYTLLATPKCASQHLLKVVTVTVLNIALLVTEVEERGEREHMRGKEGLSKIH